MQNRPGENKEVKNVPYAAESTTYLQRLLGDADNADETLERSIISPGYELGSIVSSTLLGVIISSLGLALSDEDKSSWCALGVIFCLAGWIPKGINCLIRRAERNQGIYTSDNEGGLSSIPERKTAEVNNTLAAVGSEVRLSVSSQGPERRAAIRELMTAQDEIKVTQKTQTLNKKLRLNLFQALPTELPSPLCALVFEYAKEVPTFKARKNK